jgi:acyl-CoA dehydrogenase
MDIHGGKGICMGPKNYLARPYQSIPVGITVEGANILTRTMIIFGQGAIRCHPYLVKEMEAATMSDTTASVLAFDNALTGHIGYFVTNLFRSFVYGISGSHLADSPVSGRIGSYYKRLNQMSAAFAVTSDLVLMILGGAFKRKEKLSGRFADALGYMYYASAVLKKYEDDGRQKADIPLVEWSAKYCLYQVQVALDEILRNFPIKSLGILIRIIIFPLGLNLRQPNDSLGHRVSSLLIRPSEARDRLTQGIYISKDENDSTGCLEDAFAKVLLAEPIERRLKASQQVKPGLQSYQQWIDSLVAASILSFEEAEILASAQAATRRVIMVDDFTTEELNNKLSD